MLRTTLQSENRKLVGEPGKTPNWSPRPVAVTYRAVGPSCPSTCAFLGNGCYAAQGPTSWQSKRAVPGDDDGGTLEAFVRGLPPQWILRHNVAGDLFRDDAPDAPYIEALLRAHAGRPDVLGWGYTHGWRQLDAAGFTAKRLNAPPGLTINASCDTPEEARAAAAAGWPVVFTTPSTDDRRRFSEGGLDTVTCPNQTVGVACNTCLLCAKGDRTLAVAFRHHGSGAKKADRRLEDLTPLPMAGD